MCSEKIKGGQVITDRLTVEKMAEDAFIYPRKYLLYLYNDYADLRNIRRDGTFTRAYTKTVDSISEDSLRMVFDECAQCAPSNLQYGLVYYVVNTHFKIDEISVLDLINTTAEITESMMPLRRLWLRPELIVSETASLDEIKVNVLFSTDNKCSTAEEDEFIEKQIEQYHEEQARKIYPDYGLLVDFKLESEALQAQWEEKEKEKKYITKRILFVSSGNACRSAVAESILKKMLSEAKRNDIKVESAGTINWGENPRDPKMVQIAAEHGYEMTGKTKYMMSEQLREADLILVMTPRHEQCILLTRLTDKCEKIHLFMDYCFGQAEPLQDPSGQSEEVYRKVFDIIEKGCQIIAKNIIG